MIQSTGTNNDKFSTGLSIDKSLTQQLKKPLKIGEKEKLCLDPRDYKLTTNLFDKKSLIDPLTTKTEDFSMLVANTEQANPCILRQKSSLGNINFLLIHDI